MSCRCRYATNMFYAVSGGEARSADYNIMPRSVPIKAVARYPLPVTHANFAKVHGDTLSPHVRFKGILK